MTSAPAEVPDAPDVEPALPTVYVDADGAEWSVSIDCDAVRRVRRLVRSHRVAGVVDPLELVDVGSPTYAAVSADPVLLCDILYAIVLPQAKERGVDDVAFARSLKGEAIDRALDALIGALASFSPSPARRRSLGKIHRSLRAAETTIAEALDLLIDPTELTTAIVGAASGALARRASDGGAVSGAPP